MAEIIIRARAAPVDPDRFLSAVGRGEGVEYLADIIRSSLFISQGHRDDVTLHLVLEKSADFSRIVTIQGSQLGGVGSLHETALLELVASGLRAGRALGKDECTEGPSGLKVRATSFEHLVRDCALSKPVYLLDRSGQDIRETALDRQSVFVLTDHTPMPKKSFSSMARQGVTRISVGPTVLHASQCISVIHNELDRQAAR